MYLKSIFVYFSICLSLNFSFSQVKNDNRQKETEETIDWINSKLIQHQFEYDDVTQVHTIFEVRLIEGKYYLLVEHTQKTDKPWGFTQSVFISLEDINNISFVDKELNVWMVVRIKNNEKQIWTTRDGKNFDEIESFAFMLNKSIDDENLRPRFKKAFNYLMQLYGNSSKEKF